MFNLLLERACTLLPSLLICHLSPFLTTHCLKCSGSDAIWRIVRKVVRIPAGNSTYFHYNFVVANPLVYLLIFISFFFQTLHHSWRQCIQVDSINNNTLHTWNAGLKILLNFVYYLNFRQGRMTGEGDYDNLVAEVGVQKCYGLKAVLSCPLCNIWCCWVFSCG